MQDFSQGVKPPGKKMERWGSLCFLMTITSLN